MKRREKRASGLSAKRAGRSVSVERKLVGTASDALLEDVRALIDSARTRVSRAINSELVLLYWRIGRRVREEVLGKERAAYGERVIKGSRRP